MAKQSVRLTVSQFIPRYRVTLVAEGGHTAPYGALRDSTAAASALRPCFDGLDREQFLVCCLDAKNTSIGVNIVSIGTLTLSIVHPREVFKPAILLNACAIIAVHNLCGAPHKLCYVASRIM
jgi:DNA repair protein RadC